MYVMLCILRYMCVSSIWSICGRYSKVLVGLHIEGNECSLQIIMILSCCRLANEFEVLENLLHLCRFVFCPPLHIIVYTVRTVECSSSSIVYIYCTYCRVFNQQYSVYLYCTYCRVFKQQYSVYILYIL